MTVAELIEKLGSFPGDYIVQTQPWETEFDCVEATEVSEVRSAPDLRGRGLAVEIS